MRLALVIDLARKKQNDVNNPLDMRLFVGNDVNSDIYAINKEDIESLYEKIKEEERDWFVDIYENYVGGNFAEYIDVTIWKNDVEDKVEVEEEEPPTPKTYRFLTTCVEYGYMEVVATNEEDAREKVESYDGEYFVNKSYFTEVQLESVI
jgi:hypothetical protein